MKFKTLSIQNFLTIQRALIGLDDRGLHLIQGVNESDSSASSNGAGKSSIVDAICWCLYGETAREVKGDKVVNRGAKKDCAVSIELEVGSTTYIVSRHRKHATHKNALRLELKGDPSTDLSRGTDAETQKALEKIIGSLDVFKAAVYSGQEAMPDLPRMKDRELKTLIEEASGLQRIERAYQESRERALKESREVTRLGERLDNSNTERGRADVSVTYVTEEFNKWEERRADRIKDAQTLHDTEDARLHSLHVAAAKISVRVNQAKDRIKEIDALTADHRRLNDAAEAAEQALRTEEGKINRAELLRLGDNVTQLRAKIANAESEVKKPCGACGTVLSTMTPEAFVEHQQKHLDAAINALNAAKVATATQIAVIATAKGVATTQRAAVPDVSALVTERVIENEWVTKDNDLASSIATVERNVKSYADQVAARTSEANPNLIAKQAAEKRVEEANANTAAILTDLNAAKARLAIADAVVKVFGPAGVRAQILDTVTPFLNDRTADYLTVLSDGNIQATWTTLTKDSKGDLKEKFSIDVTHAKGGDSFAEISGGEKRKVRLATALALQDLTASRAVQPISLWIGDEIDDALDPAGLERLMTILERKARERGTVLVISHSNLRDWIDNVTEVKKKELFTSTVEGSLCL